MILTASGKKLHFQIHSVVNQKEWVLKNEHNNTIYRSQYTNVHYLHIENNCYRSSPVVTKSINSISLIMPGISLCVCVCVCLCVRFRSQFPKISSRTGHSAQFIFIQCRLNNPTVCSAAIDNVLISISTPNNEKRICFAASLACFLPVPSPFTLIGPLVFCEFAKNRLSREPGRLLNFYFAVVLYIINNIISSLM